MENKEMLFIALGILKTEDLLHTQTLWKWSVILLRLKKPAIVFAKQIIRFAYNHIV